MNNVNICMQFKKSQHISDVTSNTRLTIIPQLFRLHFRLQGETNLINVHILKINLITNT